MYNVSWASHELHGRDGDKGWHAGHCQCSYGRVAYLAASLLVDDFKFVWVFSIDGAKLPLVRRRAGLGLGRCLSTSIRDTHRCSPHRAHRPYDDAVDQTGAAHGSTWQERLGPANGPGADLATENPKIPYVSIFGRFLPPATSCAPILSADRCPFHMNPLLHLF